MCVDSGDSFTHKDRTKTKLKNVSCLETFVIRKAQEMIKEIDLEDFIS